MKKPKKKPKKPTKAAASINWSMTEGHHTTEKLAGWTPPPPPAPFTSYHLPSFDAWWDMSQLITQVEDMIRIFDFNFPDMVGVFIFDCSSAHESFVEDALHAQKMNQNPGGQQPKMHNTVIPTGPFAGQVQTMSFPNDCTEKDTNGELLAGKVKGMERILAERGILDELTRKSCNRKVVAVCKQCKQSQDAHDKTVKEAKAWTDEIKNSGVELLAERNRTFLRAKTLVPECLDKITMLHIQRYFQHCYRYMDAYGLRLNLNVQQVEYAVKKYKSHHRIPQQALVDVGIMNR
ncbi:hypothetical protein EDD18DRAFT_1108705 [Armillaria luteobubalina]|uniref:Uncharacterized protein n=1 Tax=Armillaria luteobubalina TaxID=153913 RepID=A0AA39UK48_9AGAR|nr:hypothetical protein EDD18DRAFT_1108705 [Armillaria luteobubalina]